MNEEFVNSGVSGHKTLSACCSFHLLFVLESVLPCVEVAAMLVSVTSTKKDGSCNSLLLCYIYHKLVLLNLARNIFKSTNTLGPLTIW